MNTTYRIRVSCTAYYVVHEYFIPHSGARVNMMCSCAGAVAISSQRQYATAWSLRPAAAPERAAVGQWAKRARSERAAKA